MVWFRKLFLKKNAKWQEWIIFTAIMTALSTFLHIGVLLYLQKQLNFLDFCVELLFASIILCFDTIKNVTKFDLQAIKDKYDSRDNTDGPVDPKSVINFYIFLLIVFLILCVGAYIFAMADAIAKASIVDEINNNISSIVNTLEQYPISDDFDIVVLFDFLIDPHIDSKLIIISACLFLPFSLFLDIKSLQKRGA